MIGLLDVDAAVYRGLGVPDERLAVCGICSPSVPSGRGADLHERLEIAGPLVLFLGVRLPYKGFDLLLESVPVVVARKPAVAFAFGASGPAPLPRDGTFPAAAQGIDWYATVVDNASDDASAEIGRSEFAWTHLIENRARLGFSANHNQVIKDVVRRQTARYVLILNEVTDFRLGVPRARWRSAICEDATVVRPGHRTDSRISLGNPMERYPWFRKHYGRRAAAVAAALVRAALEMRTWKALAAGPLMRERGERKLARLLWALARYDPGVSRSHDAVPAGAQT